METEEPDLAPLDSSVFYALCTPLVRLAVRRGLPLRTLKHLVGMAYFHETRRQGMTGPVAAERMGVSLRTITHLSRRLKDFLTVENQHGLPRRIEYLLWAEPISAARLKQTMRAEPTEIEEALQRLLADERIRLRDDGRYEVTRRQFGLVNDRDTGARLDGLQHQLEVVADSVQHRFFDGGETAFARTYAFRVRRRDVGQVEQWYQLLRKTLDLMEELARDAEDRLDMALTIAWAPHRMVDPVEP